MTFLKFCVFLTFIPAIVHATTHLQTSVLKPPSPIETTQGQVLVYEVNLINKGNDTIRIGRIEVWNEHHQLLKAYAGTKLANDSFIYEKPNKGQFTKKGSHTFIELQKNMGAIVYLWVPLTPGKETPKKLHHKIWTVTPSANKSHFLQNTADYSIAINQVPSVVLGAPLKGENWVATGALSPNSYHRRAILPIQDHFYLAQRYAIDWVQICPNGKEARDNLHKNDHWNAFGHEVFASANAIVTKIHTTAKENTPPGLPNPPSSFEDSSGNYVILKINQHHHDYYVLYAHMQPGSIRVKEGEKVKEGQVLGLLGNTGNSSQPHLHMQVMDANDELKAEGIPYVFKKLELLGKAQEIDSDYGYWKPFATKKHLNKRLIQNKLPIENQVFQFSDDPSQKCHHLKD